MLKNPFLLELSLQQRAIQKEATSQLFQETFDDVQQVMNNRGKKKSKTRVCFFRIYEGWKVRLPYYCRNQKDISIIVAQEKQTCNEKYLREKKHSLEQMKSVIQKFPIPDDWRKNAAELDREKAVSKTGALLFVQNPASQENGNWAKNWSALDIYIEGGLAQEEYQAKRKQNCSTRKPILSKKSEILNKRK